jgi:hypoxanthine phosphoribosyltransferase
VNAGAADAAGTSEVRCTPDEARRTLAGAEVLFTERDVDQALDRVASAVTAALGDSDPVVLVVLHGALIPASLLLTRLEFPLQVGYLHVSRYRDQTTGGAIEWVAHPRLDLGGRTVLVVDDILDEGKTLAAILADVKARGAAAVFSAVLVNKRHDRKAGPEPDFAGLEVPDRYIFGYGMDYRGYWRNLRAIYALSDRE